MAKEAVRQIGIDEFVQGLIALPDFSSGPVMDYLHAYPVRPDSLQPYLFFSPANYTRNLVFKNDLFELLTICWEIGQVSRVHNHRDQQCWMTVPTGQLKNQNYRVEVRDPEKQTCRLIPSDSFQITPNAPAEVDPEEPVHQVLNLPEYGQRAVSLHIYSRPFNSCEVYQLERGSYCDVELHYTSEYGRPCQGEGTASRP